MVMVDFWKENLHLIRYSGEIGIHRFGIDKGGLVCDIEAEGLEGGIDVEIM
jgi:hypothetical protein